jgi:hypothetical protein
VETLRCPGEFYTHPVSTLLLRRNMIASFILVGVLLSLLIRRICKTWIIIISETEHIFLEWKITLSSSVGIASELEYVGTGFDSQQGSTFFSSLRRDCSEAHPASCRMGTGDSTFGAKWPGRQTDHSHSSDAEAK